MNAMRTIQAVIGKFPWLLPLLGAAAVIGITTGVSGRSPQGDLIAALRDGAILAIVGIGQMFVITAGNGNIDLSIPGVMTLAGFVGIGVASSSHSVALGVAAALLVGIIAAAINVVVILLIGVPPIVATLATNLIFDSAVLLKATSFTASTPSSLQSFVNSHVAGLPALALLAATIAVVCAATLHRTRFGRNVAAVGQNRMAAMMAGIREKRTTALCYLISGACAATGGLLLSSITGASIGIGDPYLLISVAVVVLGGSAISGGRSNVVGVLVAAVLLNVIITLFYTLKLSVAYQDIFEGVIIIAVLAGARSEKTRVEV